jgi:hypothetical protein
VIQRLGSLSEGRNAMMGKARLDAGRHLAYRALARIARLPDEAPRDVRALALDDLAGGLRAMRGDPAQPGKAALRDVLRALAATRPGEARGLAV